MINHLDFQGRMVADPELKQTNSGTSVTNFRVAWSEKFGETENKCFLDCKAFKGNADFVCKYFRKGQEIGVEGKLHTEEWEKDGQKRSKIVLMVSGVHFCGKKSDGDSAPATQDSGVTPNMTPVETDELPF